MWMSLLMRSLCIILISPTTYVYSHKLACLFPLGCQVSVDSWTSLARLILVIEEKTFSCSSLSVRRKRRGPTLLMPTLLWVTFHTYTCMYIYFMHVSVSYRGRGEGGALEESQVSRPPLQNLVNYELC